MPYVEWEGEKVLKIEVREFSYMKDIFNSSIDIVIFPNNNHEIVTDRINIWSDIRDKRNLVIYFKNMNGITKYYYLKQGIPILLNIGIKGVVNSCKFAFEEIKEISRPFKIFKILND